MNERIKELAEHAGMTQMNRRSDGRYVIDEDAFEKFAELIVKEMLQTCEDHPGWTGRMIGEEIKQHYGVEE